MKKTEGEARTRQVQLMQKQSLIDRAKERAKGEGISLNEWANRSIESYIHYDADNAVERKTRRVQLLLTPTTYDELTELNNKYNRSMNSTIEHAIQAGLSGPDSLNEAKYLNRKLSEVTSTLSDRLGGLSITWDNAWNRIQTLQKEMSSPKTKVAEKKKLQAQINMEADSLWEKICQIKKDVTDVANNRSDFKI